MQRPVCHRYVGQVRDGWCRGRKGGEGWMPGGAGDGRHVPGPGAGPAGIHPARRGSTWAARAHPQACSQPPTLLDPPVTPPAALFPLEAKLAGHWGHRAEPAGPSLPSRVPKAPAGRAGHRCHPLTLGTAAVHTKGRARHRLSPQNLPALTGRGHLSLPSVHPSLQPAMHQPVGLSAADIRTLSGRKETLAPAAPRNRGPPHPQSCSGQTPGTGTQ